MQRARLERASEVACPSRNTNPEVIKNIDMDKKNVRQYADTNQLGAARSLSKCSRCLNHNSWVLDAIIVDKLLFQPRFRVSNCS